MTVDRRQDERRRVLRRARIVLPLGRTAVDCVVLDLSEGGARLRAPGMPALPDRFALRIDGEPGREVAVRHRGPDGAGVAFLPEVKPQADVRRSLEPASCASVATGSRS